MAGEKKGEAFEALTYLALEPLGYSMHWGVKPKGFSVKPDFILGDLEAPTHWLLLTSTGAGHNTHMKFWRNLGELFEVKKFYKSPPCVVNLVFETKVKKNLQEAMAAIADSDLRVENQHYGQILLNFIDAQILSSPSSREGKVEHLRAALLKNVEIQESFQQFRADLAQALTQEKPELETLWNLLRSETRAPSKRTAKATYIRRGIAKLMICPADVRQSIYAHVRKGQELPDSLPIYLYTLGLVQDATSESELTDKEVKEAIRTLEPEMIEEIIAKSPQKAMQRWIEPLCNLGNQRLFLDYVEQNYQELITPDGMMQHLKALHSNPYDGLLREEVSGELHTVWLFYFVFDLAKSHSKKKQGFGLAELGKQAQAYLTRGTYPPNNRVWTIVTSDFINRINVETMPDLVLFASATVLSNILSSMGREGIIHAQTELEKTIIVSNLEQKLIPYRHFEPLPCLLETALNKARIKFKRINNHPAFLGEYIGKPNKVATTPVIKIGNILIHWKSAYDKGKSHKTKELSGRVQSLRFEYGLVLATEKFWSLRLKPRLA